MRKRHQFSSTKCFTLQIMAVEAVSAQVTGFGYEHDEAWAANLELFQHFTDVSRGVRRLGAAAVDLCHVALGESAPPSAAMHAHAAIPYIYRCHNTSSCGKQGMYEKAVDHVLELMHAGLIMP